MQRRDGQAYRVSLFGFFDIMSCDNDCGTSSRYQITKVVPNPASN